MSLNTVSAIVSFYEELEDQESKLFEEVALSGVCSEHTDTLLAFSKENKKMKDAMLRTYRESITDAFEVGFFSGLKKDEYTISSISFEGLRCSDILNLIIDVEEKGRRFCMDASKSSMALLPDIAHILNRAAKRRAERKAKFESFLKSSV